jgi:ABC-type polysaccharide/polyol phosphate export permease
VGRDQLIVGETGQADTRLISPDGRRLRRLLVPSSPIRFEGNTNETIAKFNPLYHAVAAIRALFNANYADGEILIGLALLVVLAVVTITFGARSFSRASA